MDDYVERASGLVVPAAIGSDVVEARCVLCGCTEERACVDDFGSTCGWAQLDPPVCTFCAAGTDGESYAGGDEPW